MIGRVRDRATFDALRRRGVRVSHGAVGLTYLSDPPRDRASSPERLVAYAIGKKAGTAVTRNRLRRRLRAIMTDVDAAVFPPGAYLVTVRRGAAEATFIELRNDVERALTRITQRIERCDVGPGAGESRG